jgi:hypothetical protein
VGVNGAGLEVEATCRASISTLVQPVVVMANRREEACRNGICVGFSNNVIPHGAEAGFQIRMNIACVKSRKRSHDFDGKVKVIGEIGFTVTVVGEVDQVGE